MEETRRWVSVEQLVLARKGLMYIREASLYLIIGSLLVSIAIAMLLFIGYSSAFSFSSAEEYGLHSLKNNMLFAYPTYSMNPLGAIISSFWVIVAVIILFVGAIIALIGIYGKLLPGAKALAQYNPSLYGTPETLIRIGYLWGVIILLIGALTLIIIIGIFLMIIAYILLFVGNIGLIILMFRLNDDFNESMFMIAGIMFIIAIFVSLADFIGWILVYAGSQSAIEKVNERIKQLELEEEREKPTGELI